MIKFISGWFALALFTATALAASTNTANAYTRYNEEDKSFIIEGGTNALSYQTLLKNIIEHGDEVEVIYMSGPGGDGRYMMAEMALIKDLDVPVIIPEGRFCASACALIALAANDLTIEGVMMFHNGRIYRYPAGATLHEILMAGVGMSESFVKPLAYSGIKHSFIRFLSNRLKYDEWLVVTSASQLDRCKYDRNGPDALRQFLSYCQIDNPRILDSLEAQKFIIALGKALEPKGK